MIKIAVLSLIFTICVFLGIFKKKELDLRKKELDTFIYFTENAKNDIFYKKKPLNLIFSDKENNQKSEFFKKLLSSEKVLLSDKYLDAKIQSLKCSALKAMDWKCIDTLFQILGKTDESSQRNMLDEILTELKSLRKNSCEDCENKGQFYVKMGLAAGAFAVIICI